MKEKELTVFIVEDSLLIVHRIIFALKEFVLAYNISFVLNGEDALEKIRQHQPDVVLLDLQLPDTNGIEILRESKKMNANTVVIVLTNNSNKYYRKECETLGVDGYYDKSTEFEEAIEQISLLTK